MSGRFYRNRRRFYRRRYGRRGYGNRSSRRAYGNMRAARQQADNATFTLNVPSKISTFMKTGTQLPGLATGDTRTVGVYPLSIYELLRRNEFFNNYANMYDEFKIDKIKVKLLPTSFTINTNGNYRNLTVYTAWDRTGLNTNQLHGYYDKSRPENNAIYCTIGEDITTYSSAESRTVNPNTNTSITRWLNPKTMGEKGQWLSTSLLKQWFVGYDDENGCFKGIQFNSGDEYAAEINSTASTSNALLKFSAASKENPCYLLEDPAIKFKPTLLIGVFPAVTQAEFTQTPNRIHFNVETEIVCTYRGLRKARVISTTTEQGQNLIVAPKPTTIQSNGTYYATTDGFNGYSSVTVAVPTSGGGGGDDSQIESDSLTFALTDDAVITAQGRTDTSGDGQSLNGFIDWPKQGQVNWGNTIQLFPNPDGKWVDTAVVDVRNLHLAQNWSQSSDLKLNSVQTSYKPGFTKENATYPEDYNFTDESGIKYMNNPNINHNLVTLRNQLVNCMSLPLNVKDITNRNYATPQDDINDNPLLMPGTHGRYIEEVQTTDGTKPVVHFAFELTDGQQIKTNTGGTSGMDVEVPLPRLYGRSFEGYFDLPTLERGVVITQPGTYELRNIDDNDEDIEVIPQNAPNNAIALTKNITLVKKNGENDSGFDSGTYSLGSFSVNVPSSSIPTLDKLFYTAYYGSEGSENNRNLSLDLANETKYIPPQGSDNEHFESNTSGNPPVAGDVGKWVCIYWNRFISGAFTFEIPNDGQGTAYHVILTNQTSEQLNRVFLPVEDVITDGSTEYHITSLTIKGFGFHDQQTTEQVIVPLSFNTQIIENKPFTNSGSGNSIELSIGYAFNTSSAFENILQVPYNSDYFHINNSLIPYDQEYPDDNPDDGPDGPTTQTLSKSLRHK